jgi:competence protein ComEA
MDETAAPWRALEDPAPASVIGAPAERSRPSMWVFAALAGAAVLVLVAFWLAASSSSGTVGIDGAAALVDGGTDDPGRESPGTPGPSGKEVVVDVQGAVVQPGVIHLSVGSRVGDAIAAAGGYGPRVAAERVGRELNLAALLRDGDKIVVPSRDDGPSATTGGGSGSAGASPGSGPIDVNRATASELDALPGIGPVTANKIIAARDEQPFASVDELRSRKILGAATFDKIKDLVVVH